MKRTTLCALTALFALSLSLSTVSAQRNRGGNRDHSNSSIGNIRGGAANNGNSTFNNRENSGYRPGNSANNNNGYRPGNNNNGNRPGNDNGYRPGGNNNFRPGHDNGFRPGNNNGNRPGNNNGYRPGNNNGYRPGNNGHRPGQGYIPAPPPSRPVTGYRPGVVYRPYRPYVAPVRPFVRPVPPVSWRPVNRINLWSSILGITVGMTISNTVNNLINAGHTIDGYDNNEVYLRNVNQYGFFWPEATMYYNNGGFVGSRFHYSTLAYNMDRYRDVFSYLTSLYGAPVSSSSDTQGATATWWGDGNQYITLSYGPMLTDSGQRYFTTLSIGI